ncbi:MAG TPA: citryl-CoA lyase [Desulfitobacterium dehalogenans]|uniref:Citryl-CoA lyase n=1 Tax=Desulfitobacterium dehalogenans TaxID=36854 RepID=A0A7C6Z273_9FIRM|nr:citryl-CoA lyase [Desulfitobacterium dehalogenans]
MKRRRSLLIISGNSPKSMQDAPVFDPDVVLFDLEERVLPQEKDSARHLVREALSFLDYSKVEVMVRINPLDTEEGQKDMESIPRVKPGALVIPKANSEVIRQVDSILAAIESEEGFPKGGIELIPVLETALGIETMNDLIKISPRVTGVWLNAEGLMAEFGSKRTKEGDELLYVRGRVGIACRAAGIHAIDTCFMDGNDHEGLEKDAFTAKRLGFTGKLALDGRQIDTLNTIF